MLLGVKTSQADKAGATVCPFGSVRAKISMHQFRFTSLADTVTVETGFIKSPDCSKVGRATVTH